MKQGGIHLKSRTVVALIALTLMVGITSELFGQKRKKVKDKRFEAVARQNLKDYEGTYVGIDSTYLIEVRVGADGGLIVSSLEGSRRARLENIRIEGARLTATKVYTDGRVGKFDGTFANRILNGDSAFGIIVSGMQVNVSDVSLSRIFYRRN
jgi:hypothetical protein